MRYATAASLLVLLLETGCYTQLYIEPDEPETLATAPTPAPEPPQNPPRPPVPPHDDPIIIVAPPPPPTVIIVAAPATPSKPMPIRDSGTQRPSNDQRDDRANRPTSIPSRSR